jgi:hypothetical protein
LPRVHRIEDGGDLPFGLSDRIPRLLVVLVEVDEMHFKAAISSSMIETLTPFGVGSESRAEDGPDALRASAW